MPLLAWTPELDMLRNVRSAWHAPAFRDSQVTMPLREYVTGPVPSTVYIRTEAASQQRAVMAFMDALGGEMRPDAEAEQAFASARAQRVRPATVVARRSSPPPARP